MNEPGTGRPIVKPLRAFVVTEETDGHACVRFDRTAIAARRHGANELDADFEYVTCRRASEFDEHAPGPVPSLILLDHGWWFECHGCGIRINRDREGWRDDEPVELRPVEDGDGLYCTLECRDGHLAYRAEKKRRETVALASLTDWVSRRFRGVLFEGQSHSYVERRTDADYTWWNERCIIVAFSFPEQKHGTCQARIDREGIPEIFVPQGDLDAWKTFRATGTAGERP